MVENNKVRVPGIIYDKYDYHNVHLVNREIKQMICYPVCTVIICCRLDQFYFQN